MRLFLKKITISLIMKVSQLNTSMCNITIKKNIKQALKEYFF